MMKAVAREPQLCDAIRAYRSERAVRLAGAGVGVAFRDAITGDTPLHMAARRGMLDVCETLLRGPGGEAAAHAPGTDGLTPLQHALHFPPRLPLVRRFLRGGSDPSSNLSESGSTALHIVAFFHEAPATVRELLAAGASTGSVDKWGWTPLHNACSQGHAAAALELLAAGADPSAPGTVDGLTPLMVAVRWWKGESERPPAADYAATVLALVRHGADPRERVADHTAGPAPYKLGARTAADEVSMHTPAGLTVLLWAARAHPDQDERRAVVAAASRALPAPLLPLVADYVHLLGPAEAATERASFI